MSIKVKRGFLGLMAVSDQPTQEIDTEIERTAMTGMLNLRDVLELVVNGFDDGTSAEQQLVTEGHQAVFHVGFELSDELYTVLKELLKGGLGEIAFVAKQLAEQALG